MMNFFENNLNEFIKNPTNTLICDANDILTSNIINLIPNTENIHLNINIHSDKDIEKLIFLENINNFKSINLIIENNFNLSKTACQKLELITNINSVFIKNDINNIKGCSFKNYISSINNFQNSNTSSLITNENINIINNYCQIQNKNITVTDITKISKEILDFFKYYNFTTITIKINDNISINFNIDILYTIIELITQYTYSININIEEIQKLNIIFKKIYTTMNSDYQKYIKEQNNSLWGNLKESGYNLITYYILKNLNYTVNFALSSLNISNEKRYFIQLKINKFWFNFDPVWNYENSDTTDFLQSDIEFLKAHTFVTQTNIEKCTISYKKFYKTHYFFKNLKNKFLSIFVKNKKNKLELPSPHNFTKTATIFENSPIYK